MICANEGDVRASSYQLFECASLGEDRYVFDILFSHILVCSSSYFKT